MIGQPIYPPSQSELLADSNPNFYDFLFMGAKEDYKSAISALHLAPHIEVIKTAQAAFQNHYSERLKEQQGQALS